MQIVPQKTYRFVINGRKIEALIVTYVVFKKYAGFNLYVSAQGIIYKTWLQF